MNEADGSVLLEAQGDDVRVNAFVEALMRRMERHVSSIDRTLVPAHAPGTETEFEIRR